MKQLLVVGRLWDDPKGVLTAVERLALVGIKLCGNVSVGIRSARFELCVTALTDANDRRWGYFHDPQFALVHDCSLAHLAGRSGRLWKSNRAITDCCPILTFAIHSPM